MWILNLSHACNHALKLSTLMDSLTMISMNDLTIFDAPNLSACFALGQSFYIATALSTPSHTCASSKLLMDVLSLSATRNKSKFSVWVATRIKVKMTQMNKEAKEIVSEGHKTVEWGGWRHVALKLSVKCNWLVCFHRKAFSFCSHFVLINSALEFLK